MSDEAKPTDLKGMLKNKAGQPVSIEEMNDAVSEQGGKAMDGSQSQSIVDLLNDAEGHDIEFEPQKLRVRLNPPKR